MGDNNQELLATLEAQGQEFLKAFASPVLKRKRSIKDEALTRNIRAQSFSVHNEDLEWTGFSSEEEEPTGSHQQILVGNATSRIPDVIIFDEGTSSRLPKPQSRGFMSSKVVKLKETPVEKEAQKNEDVENEDSELSNAKNDTLLHRLVHTKLLSGSLNPDLNMTAAQRRKALSGRILEIAGNSKLGKGEGVVRQEEKQKASKRVRDGMAAKQKEREVNSLEQAKNIGNYHPALKKLFAASSTTDTRKRERGLKMGIGKFSGGILKLSAEEISRVNDVRSARGGSRGRGTGRGRGRGRGRGQPGR